MIKRISNKLKSKKGGLKELLYDNIGIFIVGVLIVVSIFMYGNSVKSRSASNEKNIDSLNYTESGSGFSGSTTSPSDN